MADEADGPINSDEAQGVLRDYLAAIEGADYTAAAKFLAAGDEPIADLPTADLSVDSIARALAEYCAPGCLASTAVILYQPDDRQAYVAVVTFGEPRGHPLERSFVVWATDEGEPYVRGLPPAGTGAIPP
ncbi:MAG TPA: hypothetical protein VGJ86_11025 [Acidimicrobiales bacterium]